MSILQLWFIFWSGSRYFNLQTSISIINRQMNKIISKSKYLYSLFGSKANEAIIRASIHTPISSESKTFAPQPLAYNATKLSNGVTVLTQSVSVPSNVHIGIFVDVGSRDETSETSGALLSLKNTYLKTAINTSETVNYGITQMAGGQFQMEYNRENSYYHAYCLAHDVVDVYSMVADSAFEPKNYVSTSVGMYKNANSHKLETFLGSNEIFQDNIYQAAFGKKTLGNPVQGSRSNVNYLNTQVIQKFQAATLSPKRIVIAAAGVESHEEFVDVVNDKFNSTLLPNPSTEREAAKYVGGQVRNLTEANNIHIVLAFEGATYKQSLPLLVAEEILGNGRKIGRLQRNILNKHVFIDGAQALNVNYSDTGLFGIKLSGSASHAKEILNVAAKELSGLRTVSAADLELAKQSLKGKINRASTSSAKRLEERVKSLYYLGATNEHLASQIDTVTAEQVQAAVAHALKSQLTLVARGGEVTALPSYDSVSKLFA